MMNVAMLILSFQLSDVLCVYPLYISQELVAWVTNGIQTVTGKRETECSLA